MSLASPGYCNNQVSVLKYKGGNECSSALVGVPIESSSSAASLLDEFTFCGKYYFRFFTKEVHLMGIEPDLVLQIWDFETKNGDIFYQGSYYSFYFYNQTVTLDSWQNICLTVSSTQTKIVWNGDILFGISKIDVSKEKKIKATKIWLGGTLFLPIKEPNKRFEGMITNAYFWNNALKDDDLIAITTNNNTISHSATYDLISSTITNNSTCIDHLILDKNDELFKDHNKHAHNLLIHQKTDFNSTIYLCEGYGGNLTHPRNQSELKTLGYLLQQSEVCRFSFLGLTKSSDDKILDLKDNPITYLEWHLNQPNGGEIQQCIVTYDSYVDDFECYAEACFYCHIPEKSMFNLRGPIPSDMDRKYFVAMNEKNKEIRGITKTECFWIEGKWHFGKNLKLDNTTHNMPPVGLRNWNNGQKLKFTQCKKDEFTCYTYGNCISMDKRCDGFPDCPIDGSDENECKIMTLIKGYDKRYPPEKNITTRITMEIYDITDIDELNLSYTVIFRMTLVWFDSRITFYNLKPGTFENNLEILDIEKIWSPKLYIGNSIKTYTYVEAGQKSQKNTGFVRIKRMGSPKENDLMEIDEDYLYPGNENLIIMSNYFIIKLGCTFDLKW